MLSSCPPDTENQQSLTDGNSRIEPMVTHFPAITIKQMCRAAPHAFRTGTSQSKPSQTLDQWAASQVINTGPLQVKRATGINASI